MRSLLLCSALLASVIGCARENSSRQTHDPEVRGSDVSATVASKAGASTLTADQVVAHRQTAAEFIPYFRVRLNVSKLENELRSQSTTQRDDLFRQVGRAADIVSNLPPETPARTAILELFASAILAGCDSELRACRFVTLFQAIPASTTLLLFLAEDARKDVRRRYVFLSLAYAVVGRTDDARIDTAYLATSNAFEKEISKGEGSSARKALEQHREISQQALLRLQKTLRTSEPDLKTAALVSELETAFDIWNFDRARQPEAAARDEILLSLFAGKIRDQSVLDKHLNLLAGLSASASSKLAKVPQPARLALGVKTDLPRDLLTFIFDNLWLGRLTQAEASVFWNTHLEVLDNKGVGFGASSRDVREQAQAALLNYARTRFLLTAIDANKVTTDFLTSKEKFEATAVFQEVLKESLRGETLWAEAVRRFDDLQRFNDRNLRSTDFKSDTTKSLDIFFASVDRNIKLTSTYPSMLAINYHLARLGYSKKLRTWTRDIDIDGGQILDWFFDGIFEPWMAYSRDRRALSKSEIQLVFYYALELGVLSQSGADLDLLFKMLTEQMTGQLRSSVTGINDAYEISYENSPLIGDFFNMCDQQERATDTRNPGLPSISLVDLQHFTLVGVPQGVGADKFIHPTFSAGWSFFETEKEKTKMRLDENLELIRLQLTTKITRIRSLQDITKDFLNRHSPSNLASLMASIDERIKPLENLQKRFYSRVFKLTKTIGPCGEKLVQNELSTQVQVINGLVRHFRDVHEAMKTARGNTLNLNSSAELVLDKRFGFAGRVAMPSLVQHEIGLGFDAERYQMSRLQALLRIADILENGFVDDGIQHPPRRLKGSITLPTRLRDISPSWREATLRLDWNDDVDEFVTNGIQQVFDRRIGFIEWSALNSLALSMQFRIRAMAALAKAGTVATDDGPQRLAPKEVLRLTLEMQKWIEVAGTPWMNVLNITGEYSRTTSIDMMRDFAWEQDRTWWGTLDFTFKRIFDDKLGAGGGLDQQAAATAYHRRQGAIAEYTKHAVTTKMLSEPSLKIPLVTQNQLTVLLTSALDRQLNLAAETLFEIKQLDRARASNPAAFPSWRIYSSRPAPNAPLLSNSAVEQMRAQLGDIVRRTDYVVPADLQKALSER